MPLGGPGLVGWSCHPWRSLVHANDVGRAPTLTEMPWPITECSGISAGGRRCCSTMMPRHPNGALVSNRAPVGTAAYRVPVFLSMSNFSPGRRRVFTGTMPERRVQYSANCSSSIDPNEFIILKLDRPLPTNRREKHEVLFVPGGR